VLAVGGRRTRGSRTRRRRRRQRRAARPSPWPRPGPAPRWRPAAEAVRQRETDDVRRTHAHIGGVQKVVQAWWYVHTHAGSGERAGERTVVMMPTMVPRKMASSFHALSATPTGAGMNHTISPTPTEMASAFMSAPRGAGAGTGAGTGAGVDAAAATWRRPARATLTVCAPSHAHASVSCVRVYDLQAHARSPRTWVRGCGLAATGIQCRPSSFPTGAEGPPQRSNRLTSGRLRRGAAMQIACATCRVCRG
jgi:hypothetical protein